MASTQSLVYLHRVIWILIYGGLLVFITGLATLRTQDPQGWIVTLSGGAMVLGGVVLIGVRSRMKVDPPPPTPPA